MPGGIAAIVLAAGASRRMGRCKQLLPIGNRPAIVCCLETLVSAGVSRPIVVTGANGTAVAAAIRHLPSTVVRNPSIDTGMAGSVRAGLSAVGCDVHAVMICLSDQPLVAQDTIRQLLERHAAMPEKILIPVFGGRKGHPTVFPIRLLAALRDDERLTLRDIIHDNAQRVHEFTVLDRGVVLDMDTASDYRALQRLAAAWRKD